MISLQAIAKEYSDREREFKRNILREYLQYKILESVFESKHANKLTFLGGIALRIVHGSGRFSEDLDFDNFELEPRDFETITQVIQKDLSQEGYMIEIRNVYKGVYRCYIKIPRLLFDQGLSGHIEEKILIQIDTLPHQFQYAPEKVSLNKFGVFTDIFVTPLPILLSQKLVAAFGRNKPKGRDFYDIVFLLGKTKPDYGYLQAKIGVTSPQALREYVINSSEEIDFDLLVRDVRAFLINPKDIKKITRFKEYAKQVEW